ncbi:MAG: Tm-1-like ATP-binding domain-containing protein [Rhodoferax sp.]|nr:Tm-1-like ATP-binding domain-containing protein [Rhodoferax sp.]
MGTVAIVGTFDTKGQELEFAANRVLDAKAKIKLIDIGIFESTDSRKLKIDVSNEEVARRGGKEIRDLRKGGESGESRSAALEVMTRGLANTLKKMIAEGECQAILALGGSSGTSVAASAMQELPVGVPKLIVSTMASGNVSHYIGTKDICLMYSVVDIAGLNRISRKVLTNAAFAAAGMAKRPKTIDAESNKPLVTLTMFGVTTPCVQRVQEQLESRGYETTIFHATGAGGMAMEALIKEGLVDAVIDLTTTELTDEYVGGVLTAGPDRMEAAGARGIAQVVVPGAMEVINWGPENTVPAEHRTPERRLHVHNATVTVTRTNLEESRQLGKIFARKLSKAKGPVSVLLPLRGLSALDAPGQPYEDPVADQALFEEIEKGLAGKVTVRRVDACINDPEFADAVVSEFDALMKQKGKRT